MWIRSRWGVLTSSGFAFLYDYSNPFKLLFLLPESVRRSIGREEFLDDLSNKTKRYQGIFLTHCHRHIHLRMGCFVADENSDLTFSGHHLTNRPLFPCFSDHRCG